MTEPICFSAFKTATRAALKKLHARELYAFIEDVIAYHVAALDDTIRRERERQGKGKKNAD